MRDKCIEYRVVVICPESRHLLVSSDYGRLQVFTIPVVPDSRPVRQLCSAMEQSYGLKVLMVDLLSPQHSESPCVAVELVSGRGSRTSPFAPHSRISENRLSESDTSKLIDLLEDRGITAVSRIGWIGTARHWVEEFIPETGIESGVVEQHNAGRGFALLRFFYNGRHYWLKATGQPNLRECGITQMLSTVCPTYLPNILGFRPEWNAWLMEDGGQSLRGVSGNRDLSFVARSWASLQLATTDHVESLLLAGAVDMRIGSLRRDIDRITDFLVAAMARQTSMKSPSLSKTRVIELGHLIQGACEEIQQIGIPDAVLHNDLNPGNILIQGDRCVFTDWSEAAVGMPLLSMPDLCLLSKDEPSTLREAYRNAWSEHFSIGQINRAFELAPLLNLYAKIFGRGDWLGTETEEQPWFERYARTLARRMARAAESVFAAGGTR